MSLDPAAEALSALVDQFSQRSAFVRELIQNSLDAGSGRVELHVAQRGDTLLVSVRDDGEGMSREIIEDYLLVLFSSSKERDRTRIGKFGVGFASVFSLRPERVIVDTGRDGQFYRVIFDAERRYTLASVDEPIEGTTVTLEVPRRDDAPAALAQELLDAAQRWCRYARAEVITSAEVNGLSRPPRRVEAPFTVESPVTVSVEEPGFRVVMGYWHEAAAPIGYFNRGLTLLEAVEDVVPGVTFKVEASALEHTLTRDNVVRDRRFAEVITRLRALADGPLRARWLAELRAASQGGPPERHAALLRLALADPGRLPEDEALLATADGGRVSLKALRPGLLQRGEPSLWAAGPSPVVEALVAAGQRVLAGPAERRPELALGRHAGRGTPVEVHGLYWRPRLSPTHPAVEAAAAFGAAQGEDATVVAASFTGCGDALRERIAVRQRQPGALTRHGEEDARGALVVNVDHPLVARLLALPPPIGGPALWSLARRAVGDQAPTSPALIKRLAGEGAP